MTVPPLNQRAFLRSTALGFATIGVGAIDNCLAASKPESSVRIIDTHTHFYDPFRPQGVPWPGKDETALYRRVLPSDFKRIAEPEGVTGTVVVEASSWVEDNQWMLDLAAKEKFIVGFVGNLTPGLPEFAGHLKRFARNRLFRGIRVGSGALQKGLRNERFVDDMKRLSSAGLALDVIGGTEVLTQASELASRVPDLRIVIDHVANLKIDGNPPPEAWRDGMRAASQHPRVYCKVSGLVEGTGKRDGQAPAEVGFYRPVLDVVWRSFGTQRVVYGSNWPVSEPFASYATVQRIVSDYLADQGIEARRRFFSQNARDAYRWIKR